MGILDGEVALVTGGGSGIGSAMVEGFVRAGCKVAVFDRIADRAEATAGAIVEAGGTAKALCVDVTDDGAIADAVSAVLRDWGHIDILCNNAGIADGMEPLADTTAEAWSRVLAVNLTGPFLVARAVLPSMVARLKGVIINTASVAGLRGGSGGAAYTASKHGVVGLTRNIAWMYRNQGIRCNAICPGGVETDILQGKGRAAFDPGGLSLCLPVLSLGGPIAAPSTISDVAVFLASEHARAINGAILPVDQGWMAA